MLREVYCIDDKTSLYFSNGTPYQTMQKLIYYLSLSDGNAKTLRINKTISGRFLYVIYKDKTYCTKMD
jgi:hypothetical protein